MAILDYGSGANTITAVGDAELQSAITKIWDDSVDCDGAGYVSINGLKTTLALDTQGTVAFWVYLDDDSGTPEYIWSAYNSANVSPTTAVLQSWIDYSDDSLKFVCWVNAVQQWRWEGTDNWIDDKSAGWHFIAIVQNATQPVIYFDGVNITTSAGGFTDTTYDHQWFKAIYTDAPTKADNFNIGCRYYASAAYGFLDGKISDFRIWSSALSESNILALYNSGTGTKNAIGGEVFWMHGTGTIPSVSTFKPKIIMY